MGKKKKRNQTNQPKQKILDKKKTNKQTNKNKTNPK